MLGATSKNMRTTDSIKILNYVFNNYSNTNIENIISSSFNDFEEHFYNNVEIKNTTDKPILEFSMPQNTNYPLLKNEIANLKAETYYLNNLKAPLYKDTKVGFLTIKTGDEILIKLDILVKNNIEKKNFKIYYQELLKNIFNFI